MVFMVEWGMFQRKYADSWNGALVLATASQPHADHWIETDVTRADMDSLREAILQASAPATGGTAPRGAKTTYF